MEKYSHFPYIFYFLSEPIMSFEARMQYFSEDNHFKA